MGNDVDLWKMAQLCLEMTIMWQTVKNGENDFEIWEMAKIFGKWLRYMGHGLRIWETA